MKIKIFLLLLIEPRLDKMAKVWNDIEFTKPEICKLAIDTDLRGMTVGFPSWG